MPRHESTPPAAAGQHGDDAHGAGLNGAGLNGAGLRWDALIVAGGRATRLGGIDKTALVWQGRSLLDGVVAAASGARRTCVVGSDADLPANVLRAVERPRWGGPAAAIVAGLQALAGDSAAGTDSRSAAGTDWVLVLAGDLVHADAAVVLLLDTAAGLIADGPIADGPSADGVISVDPAGRRQPLLAVYRRAALDSSALLRPADNLSVMSLIGGLSLVELLLPGALGDDVDTPADAARLGIVLPAATPPPTTPQSER